jgi:hypothetical protein
MSNIYDYMNAAGLSYAGGPQQQNPGGYGGPFYQQQQQGYQQLLQQVLGQIQGVGQSQYQSLADQYAAQQGATLSSATSRGLGNTTVLDSLQRGNSLDYQKAQVALANQLAQLQAGYASQLGGAQLGFQSGYVQQQQQLQQQQALQSQQIGGSLAGQAMQKTPFGYGVPGYGGYGSISYGGASLYGDGFTGMAGGPRPGGYQGY